MLAGIILVIVSILRFGIGDQLSMFYLAGAALMLTNFIWTISNPYIIIRENEIEIKQALLIKNKIDFKDLAKHEKKGNILTLVKINNQKIKINLGTIENDQKEEFINSINKILVNQITPNDFDFLSRQALEQKALEESCIENDNLICKIDQFEISEIALKAIEEYHEYQNDYYINGNIYDYISSSLLNNKKFMLKAIEIDYFAIDYTSYKNKLDKSIVIKALKEANGKKFKDGELTSCILSEVLEDNDFADEAVKYDSKLIFKCPLEYIQRNLDLVKSLIKANGRLLQYLPTEFKEDEEWVILAIQSNGKALEFVDEKLKRNKDIVLKALENEGSALQFAPDELKGNREIVFKAVSQNGEAIEFADSLFLDDKEIVLATIKTYPDVYSKLSDELKNYHEIIVACLTSSGKLMRYVPESYKNSFEHLMLAIKTYPWAIRYTSEELLNNKEIIKAAVNGVGRSLSYASDDLRKDKEVVLLALKQDPRALEFVNDILQNDPDVLKLLNMV